MSKPNEINYLEILKKAWAVAWNNKYLWWFGLFLALGGGNSLNFNFPSQDNWEKKMGIDESMITGILDKYWPLILTAGFAIVILIIILLVLKIISQAGLLKALNRIENGEKTNFSKNFKEGIKYFWKLVLIGIILGFSLMCIIIMLSLPAMFLFYLKSFISGTILAVLAILIFIPLVILASFLGKYASFYIVLSNLKIKDSLENSWKIFRENILSSIVMALFFIPISMVLAIILFCFLLMTGIVFLLLGLALNLIIHKIGIIIAIISGSLVLLVFVLLLNSVYQVFSYATWYLFFKNIAAVKKEEIIEEREKENVKESLPSPEEV